MSASYDFIVVGAGSAGAVVASRLSEDPTVRVALLEAGGPPPPSASMPAACASLQRNEATDWCLTGDAGGAGRGLAEGRMMVPRGRMLGGSSGINYLAYVRGHPGDYDAWARDGAEGWSYRDVLPYFKKSEGLVTSPDLPLDPDAHNTRGPLGVSVRQPVLPATKAFVEAAEASGIPRGDYNGRDRLRPAGVVSPFQTTTRHGRRVSTYDAFLAGAPSARPNLEILTGVLATRLRFADGPGPVTVTGVEFRDRTGAVHTVTARREVILCAGAVGSPQLLLRSGIGPASELRALGIGCVVDSPHVGKHLKDHLHVGLVFEAPGLGISIQDLALSMGPDALRAPAGPLPADPADDARLSGPLKDLRDEAERRLHAWAGSGSGLVSSSLYDAGAWYNTGLGDPHTHDAQLALFCCGYHEGLWKDLLRVDPARYFDDPARRLAPTSETILLLANPVQPRSEGEVFLTRPEPEAPPGIRFNYLTDPHDVPVMTAVLRKAWEVAGHLRARHPLGPWLVPPHLAEAHAYVAGTPPSDALFEDLARHYAFTVYHLTSTCRMGEVVDPRLRVKGVARLRVADASVMPNVISGNTNAACIMIGEKAAERIAADHGVRLAETVGTV